MPGGCFERETSPNKIYQNSCVSSLRHSYPDLSSLPYLMITPSKKRLEKAELKELNKLTKIRVVNQP